MPFRVSGKNLDIGEALRGRIGERVAEALVKYFDGGYSGHVTIGKDGFGFRTECAIHLDSGVTLHTDGMAADAYSSADQAALRVEKRLRRYKRRLKGRSAPGPNGAAGDGDAQSYIIAAPDHESDDEITDFNPVIIQGIDHDAGAALGQRRRDGARHDRRAGGRLPPRRQRPREHGLPPRRRQHRLGRPAGNEALIFFLLFALPHCCLSSPSPACAIGFTHLERDSGSIGYVNPPLEPCDVCENGRNDLMTYVFRFAGDLARIRCVHTTARLRGGRGGGAACSYGCRLAPSRAHRSRVYPRSAE